MTAENFWEKVDKSGPDFIHKTLGNIGPCWLWTGCTDKKGYGVTSRESKFFHAHRLAYIFTFGDIPENLCVCHHCDVPRCCSGRHLFLGTNADNSADMVAKGRQSQGEKHSKAILPGRYRGERHYAHKVTDAQAIEIRRLYTETKMPQREIAEKFGLSKHAASKLMRGETWKCLGPVNQPSKRAAKLSEETVREIRRLRATGLMIKQLAHQFSLSIFTVNDIVYRRTWKDIP